MKNKLQFIAKSMTVYQIYCIAVIFLLMGVASCNNSHIIPVVGTNAQLELDTIRIGTHQYLYGSERGKYGQVLCHYEDCDNPIHMHTPTRVVKSQDTLLPYNELYYTQDIPSDAVHKKQ